MSNIKFTDQVIRCVDCAQQFAWTADEQEYYVQKGLEPPTRCPMCRAAHKAAREDKFRGKRT
jgi:rubrerythrin